MEQYDLIIIGGSAAATTAGLYAARRNLNFKIITKEFGGEVATSGEIGNWPGDAQTDGLTLAQRFRDHLDHYQAPIEEGVWVERVVVQPDGTFAILGKDFNGEATSTSGRSVIVATGAHPRELTIPGEKELRNKGVSYCTTCDGPLFVGKTTTVVGGGNSALESGLMLADICQQVYMINKNSQFKGDAVLLEKLQAKPNVKIIYNVLASAVVGNGFVSALRYKDQTGAEQELKTDGIFVHVGMMPNSNIVPDEVKKNQYGEIVVNENCETNLPGLYVAGDVSNVPFKQIVIAAGMGCVATLSAVQYLNRAK